MEPEQWSSSANSDAIVKLLAQQPPENEPNQPLQLNQPSNQASDARISESEQFDYAGIDLQVESQNQPNEPQEDLLNAPSDSWLSEAFPSSSWFQQQLGNQNENPSIDSTSREGNQAPNNEPNQSLEGASCDDHIQSGTRQPPFASTCGEVNLSLDQLNQFSDDNWIYETYQNEPNQPPQDQPNQALEQQGHGNDNQADAGAGPHVGNQNAGPFVAIENMPMSTDEHYLNQAAFLDLQDSLIDQIGHVDASFGAVIRFEARLLIVPPNVPPPPLAGPLPQPRIMPSKVNFEVAMQLIQQNIQVLNGPELVQSVNRSLAIMGTSFHNLTQTTGTRGRRYPRENDSLVDYLGLTEEQVREHAGITKHVFKRRLCDFVYKIWPKSGNDITMPIVVNYPTGFHALMYCRRHITFIRLRREVGAACNAALGSFSMWYNNGHEYTPLQDQDMWDATSSMISLTCSGLTY